MFLNPSWMMAWERTVAVVVPSPATSFVLLAASFRSWAPMFSNASSSSISFAMVTPSLQTWGAPNFLSRTTLRPFGPSVTPTVSAMVSMPRFRAARASSLLSINFAVTCCFSFRFSVELGSLGRSSRLHLEQDVVLPNYEVLGVAVLVLRAGVLGVDHGVAHTPRPSAASRPRRSACPGRRRRSCPSAASPSRCPGCKSHRCSSARHPPPALSLPCHPGAER